MWQAADEKWQLNVLSNRVCPRREMMMESKHRDDCWPTDTALVCGNKCACRLKDGCFHLLMIPHYFHNSNANPHIETIISLSIDCARNVPKWNSDSSHQKVSQFVKWKFRPSTFQNSVNIIILIRILQQQTNSFLIQIACSGRFEQLSTIPDWHVSF